MLELWQIVLIVLILVVTAAASYYVYQHIRRLPPPPAVVEPVPVLPEYVSGGENFMITLGIGTPAEISAFILFGLASNPGGVPPTARPQPVRHLHIGMRVHI